MSVNSSQQMRAYFRHVDRVRQQLVITRRSTLALNAAIKAGDVYLSRMASDIESHDQSRIRRWPKTVLPTLRRSERWYAEWATNSHAIASSLGVRPPHWLHTMDRWN